MDQKISVEAADGTREGVRVLLCAGPLTLATVISFQNVVLAETAPALILDLSGVPYIDSAGLGSLVRMHVSSQRTGRRFALAGVNERARALLQMTNLESLFQIFPSAKEAAEKLT
jgi:anti-sigma B factor antagonist